MKPNLFGGFSTACRASFHKDSISDFACTRKLLNLWQLKNVLDSQNNAAVVEAFVAWMEGFVSEGTLREALIAAGEAPL